LKTDIKKIRLQYGNRIADNRNSNGWR